MKKLLMIAVLLTGCSPVSETETRYVCDEFSSPWAYSAWIRDGSLVAWRSRSYESAAYYKIPPGSICRRQQRDVK